MQNVGNDEQGSTVMMTNYHLHRVHDLEWFFGSLAVGMSNQDGYFIVTVSKKHFILFRYALEIAFVDATSSFKISAGLLCTVTPNKNRASKRTSCLFSFNFTFFFMFPSVKYQTFSCVFQVSILFSVATNLANFWFSPRPDPAKAIILFFLDF